MAIEALGDEPLQADPRCRLERCFAVLFKGVDQEDAFVRQEQLFQQLLAFAEGRRPKVVTAGIKKIEHVVENRYRCLRPADVLLTLQVQALLQTLEGRHPPFVQRHDLAVEDQLRLRLPA